MISRKLSAATPKPSSWANQRRAEIALPRLIQTRSRIIIGADACVEKPAAMGNCHAHCEIYRCQCDCRFDGNGIKRGRRGAESKCGEQIRGIEIETYPLGPLQGEGWQAFCDHRRHLDNYRGNWGSRHYCRCGGSRHVQVLAARESLNAIL